MKMTTILVGVPIMVFSVWLLSSGQADEKSKSERFWISESKLPKGFPKPGKSGEILIKEYPKYRMARVKSEEMERDQMFWALFQHIKQNKISMTAPVEMTYNEEDQQDSMAFLYGNLDLGKTGEQDGVEVVDIPAMTVVSIGLRGDYKVKRFKESREKLEAWLEENEEWTADGEARYFAYNSPGVPRALRYGEVQIPVKARAKAEGEKAESGTGADNGT